MVRGKPILTFGDEQHAVVGQMRDQETRRARRQVADNAASPGFASFLPGPGKGNVNTASPAQQPAPASGTYDFHHDMLLPLKSAAQQKLAATELAPPRNRAATGPAALPAGLAEARTAERKMTRNARSRKSAPVDTQASFQALSGGPSVNARNGERIFGRPITGRSGIGMEDTRPADRRPSARRFPGTVSNAEPQGVSDGQIRQFARQSRGRVARKTAFDGYSLHNPGFGLSTPPDKNSPVAKPEAPGAMPEAAGRPQKELTFSQVEEALAARRRAYFSQEDEDAMMRVRSASHKRRSEPAQAEAKDPAAGAWGANLTRQRGGHARTTGQNTAYGANAARPLSAALKNMALGMAEPMGFLAAKFESGAEGIAAIGYDRHGGTSYGKFQLSSRAGTMDNFIQYLREKEPHMARRLAAAGPSNTGGRRGRMPDAWRAIAAVEPERFEQLQNDFIKTSHFEPAMQAIAQNTGVAFGQMPAALQEVLFSTAVQHGVIGATRIFSRALERVDSGKLQNQDAMPDSSKRAGRDLIKQVYAIRAGQFVSSTNRVQAAVRNRLSREMNEALNMLA